MDKMQQKVCQTPHCGRFPLSFSNRRQNLTEEDAIDEDPARDKLPAMNQPDSITPLLRLGFRPLFLAAACFAVIAVAIWMASYSFGIPVHTGALSTSLWHGHEMLFGYALAVIGGFLLTAIGNWTGRQTLRATPLLLLVLLWLAARILYLVPGIDLQLIAVFDLLFNALLVVATAIPIFQVQQWKQVGILVKLLLILLANLAFYLGVLGIFPGWETTGLYAGIYLVLSLILMIGRRVLPFFIQNGVGYAFAAKNYRWLDISSLVLFVAFVLAELFVSDVRIAGVLAAMLFVLHVIRLIGWHTRGIWSKPLLWVLFCGYSFIVLGFALKAASVFAGVSPFLALHAFTYGGIGMMTLGMMARVTLGHTGRNVSEPPAGTGWMFVLLGTGAFIRVMLPLLAPGFYAWWIELSQVFWMAAFAWFVVVFAPMLASARVDGGDG